jgi:hypothetical protein
MSFFTVSGIKKFEEKGKPLDVSIKNPPFPPLEKGV